MAVFQAHAHGLGAEWRQLPLAERGPIGFPMLFCFTSWVLSPVLPTHTMVRPSDQSRGRGGQQQQNALFPWGFIPFVDGQDFLALSDLSPKTISVMLPYTVSLVLNILQKTPGPAHHSRVWERTFLEADGIPGIHVGHKADVIKS